MANTMSETKFVTPFWFPQRHCQAEEVNENYYRITAPNMATTYLGVRQLEGGVFQGYFRREQDGPDDTVTEMEFGSPVNAWEGAFELFREKMIL